MKSEISRENGRRSYMDYLPGMYREDDFTTRFLHIFEDIIQPLEMMIDKMHFKFDPSMTDPSLLPWLSTWVGVAVDERWPEERRRQLLASAAELYRWRGTRLGMMEYLRIYTGVVPQITEPAVKGKGKSALAPCQFMVELEGVAPGSVDINVVKSIIESQKPAHTTYILKMNE